jgi:hypothetical protein
MYLRRDDEVWNIVVGEDTWAAIGGVSHFGLLRSAQQRRTVPNTLSHDRKFLSPIMNVQTDVPFVT